MAVAAHASAGNATANLNFQGFTGLLHVPSARVLDYGDFQYNFSNLNDLSAYRDGYNNQLGVGVFPGIELALKNVTSDRDRGSDLSGNIKWQLPYLANDTWAIALGVQDLGGVSEASYYDSQYLVGSYRWKNVDVSLGIANSDYPNGRMNGVFAGVEWAPFDWLGLMAEHDGHAENIGLRLSTPRNWLRGKLQLSAMAQIYSSEDTPLYDGEFYAFSIKIPLASSEPGKRELNQGRRLPEYYRAEQFRREQKKPVKEQGEGQPASQPQPAEEPKKAQPATVLSHAASNANSPVQPDAPGASQDLRQLHTLAGRLARHGFEGVKVAQQGDQLFVRFESAVFNRHAMDGLGVAMGVIAGEAPEGARHVQLVLMKWGIPVFKMEGELARYRDFLQDEQSRETGLKMQVSPRDIARDVNWLAAGRSPYYKLRWTVRPVVASTIGTEYGVLDYSFAWRHEFEAALWPGAAVYAAYDIPGRHTRDFNDGRVFAGSRYQQDLKHVMLSQAFTLPGRISSQFMAGQYAAGQSFYNAVSNESWLDMNTPFQWFPGSHRFRTFVGEYRDQDVTDTRRVMLFSYRYYLDAINSSMEITAGDFFNDSGWRLEARHHFGDTTFSTYLKSNDDDVNMFGMSISMPLTARKDMSSRYGVQVKGPASWRYDIETRVGDDHNQLARGVAVMPTLSHGLRGSYYSDDRLNPAWVQQHVHRLREAWLRFKNHHGDWGSWGEDTGLNKVFD